MHRRIIELLGIMLVLTAFAVTMNGIPPLTTTIARDIGTPYESFGYIFMLQFLFFTIAAFVGGWLSDKFNVSLRTLVLMGFVIACITLFLANFLGSFAWFVVWIIPLGFAGGLLETFSTIIVSNYDKPGSGRLVNLSQGFFCFGAVLAPQMVSVLLKQEVSWRLMFLLFSGFLLCIGLLFMMLYRPKKAQTSQPDSSTPESSLPKSKVSESVQTHSSLRPDSDRSGQKSAQASETIPLGQLLKKPLFILLAGAVFLYVAAETSTAMWVAPFFENNLGVHASEAAWRIGLFWGGMLIGRFVVVFLPSRFTLWEPLYLGVGGMVAMAVLLSFPLSVETATVCVGLMGLFCGPVWPCLVSISNHATESTQFTSGVVGVGGLGVAFGPYLSSLVIRFLGITLLFLFIMMITLALVTITFFVRRRIRQ